MSFAPDDFFAPRPPITPYQSMLSIALRKLGYENSLVTVLRDDWGWICPDILIRGFSDFFDGYVVEVDDPGHEFTKEEDENRTQRLNQLNFHVLRITNVEVKADPLEAAKLIIRKIEAIHRQDQDCA